MSLSVFSQRSEVSCRRQAWYGSSVSRLFEAVLNVDRIRQGFTVSVAELARGAHARHADAAGGRLEVAILSMSDLRRMMLGQK